MKERFGTSASENPEFSVKQKLICGKILAAFIRKRTNEEIDFATVLVNESSNKVFYVHLTSSKNRIPGIHDHGYSHAHFDTAAT